MMFLLTSFPCFVLIILINFSSSLPHDDFHNISSIHHHHHAKSSFKHSRLLPSSPKPPVVCAYKSTDVTCVPDAFYRTFDGTCNNLVNHWWGSANIPFRRLTHANYADGQFYPRNLSVTGVPLVSPRTISNACSEELVSETERSINSFFTTFAQFVDHDLSSAANGKDDEGHPIICNCNDEVPNPFCLNIATPDMADQACMLFPRSTAPFQRDEACQHFFREQVNQINSFLDASLIYGNNKHKADELRTFKSGLLKTTERHLPPQTQTGKEAGSCRGAKADRGCFVCGDARSNENIGLTALHTTFLRLHNVIALSLSTINPHWSDDITYHEARRIVTAVLQHVVYKEFLPAMIGPSRANLGAYQYDSTVDASIANEFATAAYRFGHTLVNGFLRRYTSRHELIDELSLGHVLFRPAEAYNKEKGGLDSLTFGLLLTPAAKYDSMFSNVLRNHLFEAEKLTHPVQTKRYDLSALNINRGRDHGLPTYNTMRRFCGLRPATSFADLTDTMDQRVVDKLASVYAHVDDIDLYIGGVSERSVAKGVVGPTFACIIARQFDDLRRGDRFFYETKDPSIRFTADQLNEILRVSLASILCQTAQEITEIQFNALKMPDSSRNPYVSCASLPFLNLLFWRE